MSQPGFWVLSAFRRLSSFLFICWIVFGLLLIRGVPWIILGLAAGLMLGGVPLFIYGLKTLQRYKDVFDYEPTEFRGKPTNGVQVRNYLIALNVIGLWCALSGLALLLIFALKGPIVLVLFL